MMTLLMMTTIALVVFMMVMMTQIQPGSPNVITLILATTEPLRRFHRRFRIIHSASVFFDQYLMRSWAAITI